MTSIDQTRVSEAARQAGVIWAPHGADKLGWITRATSFPIRSDVPAVGQGSEKIYVLWPSAQSYVARAIVSGGMPSVALEGWLIHARALSSLLERAPDLSIIDMDASLADPLVALEAMGIGADLAIHATQAPPTPSGLPILIAAETVAADPDAARLDAEFSRLAAGLDAALDVDDLAQSYSDAVLQGNVTAIEQLRDELMNRQMLRRANVAPVLENPMPAPPEDTTEPFAHPDEVLALKAEIKLLHRILSGRDRAMSRTQARVMRLEGLLNALITDTAQDLADHDEPVEPVSEPAPISAPLAEPEQGSGPFGFATDTISPAPGLQQTFVPPMSAAGLPPGAPPMAPGVPDAPTGDRDGAARNGYEPFYAADPAPGPVAPQMPDMARGPAPAQGMFPDRGQQPPAYPGYPAPGAGAAPSGQPSGMPAGQVSEPPGFGGPGFGGSAPQQPPQPPITQPPGGAMLGERQPYAPPQGHDPGMQQPQYQPAYPQFANPYQQAGTVPIHAYATPDNPLALPPEHTTQDLGPDRPPQGSPPAQPAKKGGLLGRLRRR